jgi:hypothetical protein
MEERLKGIVIKAIEETRKGPRSCRADGECPTVNDSRW